MRKLLAILMMVLFVGCGTTVPEMSKASTLAPLPASSEVKKVPAQAPAPAPTKEEVLKEAKTKQEIKIFAAWWTKEMTLFASYMESQMRVPIKIETIQVSFIDDFKISTACIIISSPAQSKRAYFLIVRPGGKWKLNTMIFEEEIEEMEETEEDENEHQL